MQSGTHSTEPKRLTHAFWKLLFHKTPVITVMFPQAPLKREIVFSIQLQFEIEKLYFSLTGIILFFDVVMLIKLLV